MKSPKIIKANFNRPVPPKVELPKIPDLILKFASDVQIFQITVPAQEMGKMAKAFCDLMDAHGIVYSIEERSR